MSTALHSRGSTPREELAVGSERIIVKLATERSGGGVVVFDVTVPPGGGPAMLHRHDAFELYHVRRGELAIYLAGEDGAVRRTVAGPGAVVAIGGGLEHTIRNESDRDAEAVVVFSPGESMERFARAVHDLSLDQTPAREAVLAVAQAHGIEMTRSIEDALANTGAGFDEAPAYLTIARFSGDPDLLLNAYSKSSETMSAVGRDHGLILHACAKSADGFLILNLWPSKHRSEAAARDPRRLGVIERADISPSHIHREHYDLAQFVVFDSSALAL